jgi:hypothetical protein
LECSAKSVQKTCFHLLDPSAKGHVSRGRLAEQVIIHSNTPFVMLRKTKGLKSIFGNLQSYATKIMFRVLSYPKRRLFAAEGVAEVNLETLIQINAKIV